MRFKTIIVFTLLSYSNNNLKDLFYLFDGRYRYLKSIIGVVLTFPEFTLFYIL
nr:MAG TPA: hypothetical protein [Caudoviricetes sp.]